MNHTFRMGGDYQHTAYVTCHFFGFSTLTRVCVGVRESERENLHIHSPLKNNADSCKYIFVFGL